MADLTNKQYAKIIDGLMDALTPVIKNYIKLEMPAAVALHLRETQTMKVFLEKWLPHELDETPKTEVISLLREAQRTIRKAEQKAANFAKYKIRRRAELLGEQVECLIKCINGGIDP